MKGEDEAATLRKKIWLKAMEMIGGLEEVRSWRRLSKLTLLLVFICVVAVNWTTYRLHLQMNEALASEQNVLKEVQGIALASKEREAAEKLALDAIRERVDTEADLQERNRELIDQLQTLSRANR